MLRITPGTLPAATASQPIRSAQIGKAIERAAAGLPVDKPADASASLTLSEGLKTPRVGDSEGLHNAMRSTSLLQTVDGALAQSHDMLNRMRRLSVEAAHGSLSDDDRTYLQTQLDAFSTGLDSVADGTQYGGHKLLDGSLSGQGLSLPVGAKAGDTRTLKLDSARAADLGLSGLSVATGDDAVRAIEAIDKAIGRISDSRTQVGAHLNGIQASIAAMQPTGLGAGPIQDADQGAQAADLATAQIRTQSKVAMQAQSNVSTGAALRLLM